MIEIKSDYEGISICYDRHTNKWRFTLEGQEYSCDSLNLTETRVDEVKKAISLKRRKSFDPIPAFHGLSHGRITSLCEETSYDHATRTRVPIVRWIKDGERGGPEKVAITSLHPDTPENSALIQSVQALQEELRRTREKLTDMSAADLPVLDAESPLALKG